MSKDDYIAKVFVKLEKDGFVEVTESDTLYTKDEAQKKQPQREWGEEGKNQEVFDFSSAPYWIIEQVQESCEPISGKEDFSRWLYFSFDGPEYY